MKPITINFSFHVEEADGKYNHFIVAAIDGTDVSARSLLALSDHRTYEPDDEEANLRGASAAIRALEEIHELARVELKKSPAQNFDPMNEPQG